MAVLEVLKRAVPFVLAMIIGVLAALPFAGAWGTTKEDSEGDESLRIEIRRLKSENCRLRMQMRRMERTIVINPGLDVPEPPMPPAPPVAPLAPPPPPPPLFVPDER